ncbi:unnamed protein product [Alternaria sp. RS040]
MALSQILRRDKQRATYMSLLNPRDELDYEEGFLKEADCDAEGSSTTSDDASPRAVHTVPHKTDRTLICLNLILFMVSMISFTTTFLVRHNDVSAKERNYFLKHTSEKSPVLEQLDIPLTTWRLNGTFIEMGSIYRGRPSPEVDAAWERVETQTPIPISREDVVAQGKDPEDAVKWPVEFGFGPDAYIGRIDVFHQIHCLNVLRKHLHFNYDYYYAEERMNKYHELHTGHCVHILLQNIMCTGNVDVYPHFWADAQENAVPDFNINHKCRDFEAILKWHDEHAVPLDEFGALRIPDSKKPRIMVHAFKEAFEWYDAEHPDDGDLGTAIG